MKSIKPAKVDVPLPQSSLIRSEETKHGYFETFVYALLIASAVAAILQFAMQPNPLPFASLPGSVPHA